MIKPAFSLSLLAFTGSLIGSTLLSLGGVMVSPQAALAQSNSCRQVTAAINGLNVRQAPGLDAAVVGVVPGGSDVTLVNRGTDGWVPITAPVEGYISSRYLILCEEALQAEAPPAAVVSSPAAAASSVTSCQQVIVRSGLNVRAKPTVYSTRLGALPTGSLVQTSGPEVNQWVPIEEPLTGYVAARFLGDC